LNRSGRRPHALLLVALAIAVAYGSLTAWQRATRPSRWVGTTECAWRGKPRVRVRSGLRPVDSTAVLAHERVHAAQCEALGPVRYRWRNLFAMSKLALETPAYCAGARERARLSGDTTLVRMTMTLDITAAMADVIDSVSIARSIASTCPEFAASIR
jgi:hypothetical protein